jgi:hypothetical protein
VSVGKISQKNNFHDFEIFAVALGAASQRIEALTLYLAGHFLNMPFLLDILADWKHRERGLFPGLFESFVIIYITGKLVKFSRYLAV